MAEDSSTKGGTPALYGGLYAYGGDSVIACVVVFAVLCTVFLALRFMSHRIGRRPISLSDWLMIPCWFLIIGLCASVVCSVGLGGVGRHAAYVAQFMPNGMTRWAETLLATEVIYGVVIPLEKTSILLLYLRLFHIHRWFRVTTYVLIAYIWMWASSEILVAIFQCSPVALQWDKSLKGVCIDQLQYYRWISVPNVIHDLVMLAVPMPVVWKLQVSIRQKVALIFVFLVGSIGCVASFIRLSIFFKTDAFSDPTWASIQLMSWTLAEPGVIFICACMPSLWPMLPEIPCLGSVFNRSGNSTSSRSRVLESKPGAIAGAWDGQPRGLGPHNDNFIPLDDVEDRAGTHGVVSSPGRRHEMVDHSSGRGISVTKEFSWVSVNGQPFPHDYAMSGQPLPHMDDYAMWNGQPLPHGYAMYSPPLPLEYGMNGQPHPHDYST
ncbi:Uu.00g145560.m01.CDS01 [Anthostomella pinea]|uniref:Uu.00g145560.m01.CDS01 n=1 Tax=Anthostomella pinea TaxID=933095 RepID=A0AAI8YM02_9PEZI|nr:Uu.00g145560.m01.CDS01 [Anthostomella pinea]